MNAQWISCNMYLHMNMCGFITDEQTVFTWNKFTNHFFAHNIRGSCSFIWQLHLEEGIVKHTFTLTYLSFVHTFGVTITIRVKKSAAFFSYEFAVYSIERRALWFSLIGKKFSCHWNWSVFFQWYWNLYSYVGTVVCNRLDGGWKDKDTQELQNNGTS